jgi:hypothetical protein
VSTSCGFHPISLANFSIIGRFKDVNKSFTCLTAHFSKPYPRISIRHKLPSYPLFTSFLRRLGASCLVSLSFSRSLIAVNSSLGWPFSFIGNSNRPYAYDHKFLNHVPSFTNTDDSETPSIVARNEHLGGRGAVSGKVCTLATILINVVRTLVIPSISSMNKQTTPRKENMPSSSFKPVRKSSLSTSREN